MPAGSDPPDDPPRAIIARCTECGSAYVARRWPDGRIHPIHRPAGCECGSTTFVDLTSTDGTGEADDHSS